MTKLLNVLHEIVAFKLQPNKENDEFFDVVAGLERKDYNFLYNKNIYFKLFKYLHEDVGFRDVFTKNLQLQMGIFAYVSPSENFLRYLYGKQNFLKDKSTDYNPHFYLPSYFFEKKDGVVVSNKVNNFKEFMDVAYNLRNFEQKISNIDFVKTFNGKIDNRSYFEVSNNLIYISSGEMDFFSLATFLLSFDNAELQKNISSFNKLSLKKENWQKIILNANLSFEKVDKLTLPFLNISVNLEEWFYKFGFITSNSTKESLSERGERLISYVKLILFRDNIKNNPFDDIKNELRKSIKTPLTLKKICSIIFINYYNKYEKPLKKIISESRFSIIPHFWLRYIQGFSTSEQLSRAWIVFPTLYDNSIDNEQKAVGFFLGTFRDMIQIDDQNVGIFEYLIDNDVPPQIQNIFNQQKLIIKALAEVEDNEIYFKSIIKKVDKDNQDEILLKAIINALSKVMARNQSHNIGSHVLSRLVLPENVSIDSVMTSSLPNYICLNPKKTLNNSVKTLKNQFLANDTKLTNQAAKNKADKKYYNNLIAYFFSYLKTRQDLLADIVSGVPQVQSSKWFKGEIMKGIDDNRLLLNRISGVGDFKYRFDIVFGDGLGDDVQMAISNDIMGQHAFYIILENIIRNTAKHGAKSNEKDFEHIFTIYVEESENDSSHYKITIYDNVDIEGYTCLKLKKEDRVLFSTDNNKNFVDEEVCDSNNEPVLISKICDNNTFGKEDDNGEFTKAFFQRAANYPNELKYLGSDESYDYFKILKIDHLVTNQNVWINKKILDQETFDLRQQALGLIEMETCTAYLRRTEIEKIEHKDFELEFSKKEIDDLRKEIQKGTKQLRFLRAVRPLNLENSTYEKRLGYRFYIPKPKELLIIDEKGDLWEECKEKGTKDNPFSQFKILESKGILLLNASDNYNKEWDEHWKYDEEMVYQHSIMLLNLKDDSNNKFKDNAKLPKRYVTYDKVKETFELYEKKFTENNGGKKRSISEIVSYNIYIDISKPRNLINEVWRAYLSNKITLKNIDCFNISNFNNVTLVNKDCITNKLNIGYAVHGDRRQTNEDIFIIAKGEYEEKLKSLLDGDNKNVEDLVPLFQMIDAMLTNVLILDERIQELSNNTYTLQDENNTRITYREIWDKMNVFIPTQDDINLGTKSFKSKNGYRRDIINLLKAYDSRLLKNFDFIIIHLGVIEKILISETANTKNDVQIKEFLDNLNKQSNAKIIITSGRAPQNLPEEYAFVSYSILSQYLIEKRVKFDFNEVINSSRPKI